MISDYKRVVPLQLTYNQQEEKKIDDGDDDFF